MYTHETINGIISMLNNTIKYVYVNTETKEEFADALRFIGFSESKIAESIAERSWDNGRN